MSIYKLDQEAYAAKARQVVAEGCVLLKNDNSALPLKKDDKVAVFGRIASTYYKSGLGSGGMVNTNYVVGILDALREEKDITVIEAVRDIYDAWVEEHPFDHGAGWGQVPWSQAEMPVSDELFAAAEGADVAVVVIGRTAGEDQDNSNDKGAYLLSDDEEKLICEVSKKFERTVVLLNVGNIIDMTWVEKYNPAAVMYVWQGGMEGGNGVVDVLSGRVNPSGCLTDTIAKEIEDYPSHPYFGEKDNNNYSEDIYVGYRYFETFAKDKVLYPFGFGLSYTSFDMDGNVTDNGDTISVEVKVSNTGVVAGKKAVQVYVACPNGKLGKPALVLAGFAKTSEIVAGADETVTVNIPKVDYASYDDSGVTGHKDAFVLEEGQYHIFIGDNAASVKEIAVIDEEFTVIEQLEEVLAPVESFERFKNDNGKLVMEEVPVRTVDVYHYRDKALVPEAEYTGDKGYKLADVYNGKVDMDTFVAQLSDVDLIYMSRGEGMCSPKVTPGTAAAFGGITDSLTAFGIPALCATDGPSGIRMDCGTKAFSLPNGTLLGCTFDAPLVQELYEYTGKELRQNRIDTLLGPGMNIHRHPLNGRNFEYISEDPLVTGKMAAAQIVGMSCCGSTGTAKHFATNNQESARRFVNASVSARALREIYLKGFEIAVKEGKCRSIMTTYGSLNGLWTAGSYELCTKLLRQQWGFKGLVMTDWWAEANIIGEKSTRDNHSSMLKAGNDVYMTVGDTTDNAQDDILAKFETGVLTRTELVRNAKCILGFALESVAMQYELGAITEEELEERKNSQSEEDRVPDDLVYYDIAEGQDAVLDISDWKCENGDRYVIGINTGGFENIGTYDVIITASSELNELAQIPVTVYIDSGIKTVISFRGTEGKTVTVTQDLGLIIGTHYMKFAFGASGLKVEEVRLKFREKVELPF